MCRGLLLSSLGVDGVRWPSRAAGSDAANCASGVGSQAERFATGVVGAGESTCRSGDGAAMVREVGVATSLSFSCQCEGWNQKTV